jgi:hypothetical protein
MGNQGDDFTPHIVLLLKKEYNIWYYTVFKKNLSIRMRGRAADHPQGGVGGPKASHRSVAVSDLESPADEINQSVMEIANRPRFRSRIQPAVSSAPPHLRTSAPPHRCGADFTGVTEIGGEGAVGRPAEVPILVTKVRVIH